MPLLAAAAHLIQGRALQRHVRAAADAAPRPPCRERYREPGHDPMRILLFGGGNAIGYGVRSRSDALDGQLGGRLAAATGRGVFVDNLASPDLDLDDQVSAAAVTVGCDLAELIVWCPSFTEMARRRPHAHWYARLTELLTLAPRSRALVLALPLPEGDHETSAAARRRITAINADLQRLVDRDAALSVVIPPPVRVRELGVPMFDAPYYAEVGERVAAAFLRATVVA